MNEAKALVLVSTVLMNVKNFGSFDGILVIPVSESLKNNEKMTMN